MSNPYRDKLLGIGYLSHGRTKPRVREGRQHPETGVPWKATTDEAGNTQTEHATRDDRVDAVVRPAAVRVVKADLTKRKETPRGDKA